MEKVLEGNKVYAKTKLGIESVYILFFAIMVGCVPGPISFALAFILLAYFYMRDNIECRIVVVGILLGSLSGGLFISYLYALGITLFFLSVHVLRLLNWNIYRGMPYICAFLLIPYGIYTYHVSITWAALSLISFVLVKDVHKEYSWIQKKLILSQAIYGILVLSIAMGLGSFLPITYMPYLILAAFLFISFLCNTKILFLLLTMNYLIQPNLMPELTYIFVMIMISLWKEERWTLSGAIVLFGIIAQADVSMMIVLSICGLVALFYNENHIPFHITRIETIEPILSPQSILKRQIQNFSSIFESLSKYYKNISDVEAQMLSDMAMALKYSADALKKLDTQESTKERILEVMEGYQYDVLSFSMEEIGEGNLNLEMDIRNINKPEIRQTLLPLMEVLTHEHLRVSEVKHHRFTKGYHHITLENHVPYTIDAYADSLKNMFETSGDAFSIFRFRNTMIAMISDGMGSGEAAATSSRLITNIFQRMVISGIPKADSIKCINKLLQSDAYATLDVICFDCSEGLAYIFKSAACPTFLIRDNEIYEVNGSSLPVGIISSIEPDCFVAQLEEGDEYLMVSDGIFMDEIYDWLKNREQNNSKKSVESLMNVLKKKQRLDDSTAVLSRVSKSL